MLRIRREVVGHSQRAAHRSNRRRDCRVPLWCAYDTLRIRRARRLNTCDYDYDYDYDCRRHGMQR